MTASRRTCIILGSIIGIVALVTCFKLIVSHDGREIQFHQNIAETSTLRVNLPPDYIPEEVQKSMTIVPSLDVETRLEDSSMFLKPLKTLEKHSVYTIIVPKGIPTVSGQRSTKELRYTFTVTGAPVVTASFPENGSTQVPTNVRISIIFDRPMIPLEAVQSSSSSSAQPPVKIGRAHV